MNARMSLLGDDHPTVFGTNVSFLISPLRMIISSTTVFFLQSFVPYATVLYRFFPCPVLIHPSLHTVGN